MLALGGIKVPCKGIPIGPSLNQAWEKSSELSAWGPVLDIVQCSVSFCQAAQNIIDYLHVSKGWGAFVE